MKPSDDPSSDELRNRNISQSSSNQEFETMSEEPTEKQISPGDMLVEDL